ncbi:hypothetical protein PRZ48_001675 [Zasmidium cellare]|uniref:Glycine zipper 2TM domain-containing protein n=1 Tax=Zasmidium cellare TaxID=395010 RepID=A0ABR0F3F7_ZASCE|nr:hypothetical protein PRZ48_001675 [Zasmidium cellare]
MAAADYYNPGGQQPGGHPPAPIYPPQQLHPPQQNNSLNVNPPYPMSDAPPPYTAYAEPPRPHSQPPPQHRPPPNDQYRPPQPPNGHVPTHAYPPDKLPRPAPGTHNMYKPSDFGGAPYTPQPYQQPAPQPHPQHGQDYFPLSGTPAMAQVYGNGNNGGRRPSTTPGYRPPRSPLRDDDKRDRSRSRSRSRHRKHHHDRPQAPRKKSSGVNTFLGAGGGALIGDAIFPGLGTLGGAIIGGLGGHEYGKRRPASNPNRSRGRSYSNDFDYGDDYRRGRKY